MLLQIDKLKLLRRDFLSNLFLEIIKINQIKFDLQKKFVCDDVIIKIFFCIQK